MGGGDINKKTKARHGRRRVLRLRRGEALLLCLSAIMAAGLNALMLWKFQGRFALCSHVGFYSLFMQNFLVSGFDPSTLIFLSNGQVCFDSSRHPLLMSMLYPLYLLNTWLMDVAGVNCAACLMAAVDVACVMGASLSLFRLLRYAMRLAVADCLALWGVMFSVAYIMLAAMVPDHFALSLFLLTFTLYRSAMLIRLGRPMGAFGAGLLLLLTAGTTLTNGAKTCLAVLFTSGRRAFSPSRIVAFTLVVVSLWGVWHWQDITIEEPQRQRARRIERQIADKQPERMARLKRIDAFRRRQNGQAMTDGDGLLRLSDISTPRWRSVSENLMGETFLLHDDCLLRDIQRDRPVFVPYRGWFCPLMEWIIALAMAAGLWAGRRDRVAWPLMAWLTVDAVIHIGFGFALNEVYIMAAHWAFAMPVLVGFGVRRCRWMRLFYIPAALMMAHNLRLICRYFLQ